MYVVEVFARRDTGVTGTTGAFEFAGHGLANAAGSTVNIIIPAEKCVWAQNNATDGRGYRISNLRFYPGASLSSGNNEEGQGLPAAHSSRTVLVRLGYLGKSGRFVPISE